MNKTIKGFVAFALVSTMAGSALFAAPKSHARPERPGIERELNSQFAERTMVGKVRETKWGFLTLETDDGEKYVLNATGNPDLIGFSDLKIKAGNRMVLTGNLDKESHIFTVTHFGKKHHHDYADAK